MRPLVVALTGASGAIYGIRALEVLSGVADVETHLIVTAGARTTIKYETSYSVEQVKKLADVVHADNDLAASVSSGSFATMGMLVIPCSIKTASGIAHSFSDNLVIRAADVTLKEQRRLVLLVRETPLHVGHLRMLTQVAEMGAIVLPPVPAFYSRPETLDDVVNHTVGRTLDLFGIDAGLVQRWSGRPGLDAPAAGTKEAT